MGKDRTAKPAEAQDMLQQAAEISVMDGLRRGRAFQPGDNFGIAHRRFQKLAQPGIFYGGYHLKQFRVQIVYILFCAGKEIRAVHFALFRPPDFFNGQLDLVAVALDARLNFHKVVALDLDESRSARQRLDYVDVVPDLVLLWSGRHAGTLL